MTDEQTKPPEKGACVNPECPETVFYVQQLGADMAESGNMAPMIHVAVAMGLLVAGGAQNPEDANKVFSGLVTALTESFDKAMASESLRKSAHTLVNAELVERKKAAKGDARVTAMHVKVPGGTKDEALRTALASLKQSGVVLDGLMAFGDDGTLLYSEGDIPAEMIPPGAKSPADVKKH